MKTEKCSGGKHSKIRITGLAAANAVDNKLPMLLLIKQKIQGVLEAFRNFFADIDHKERAGWKKSSIGHWQLPGPSNY